MVETISLEIVKVKKTEKHVVEWVDIDGQGGNFMVAPGHSPLISLLDADGFITYKPQDSEAVTIESGKGFFMIVENKATVLFDV